MNSFYFFNQIVFISGKLYECQYTNVFRRYMHLYQIDYIILKIISSTPWTSKSIYTFYKIQNKLEQKLPEEEKNLMSATANYKEHMG